MQSSQKDNIAWIKEDSMRFFYFLQILFHFQKISLLIFYHLLHIQQLNKEFKDHLLTKSSIKLFHQRRHKVFILSIQTINLVYKSSFYSSTYCLVASSFSDLFLLLVSFWGVWLCYKYKLIQMSQTNYKGLPNIGATCYINSFLQTLFMTPQFRQGIYEWVYNEKIHPKQSDSILFQLQKLFAKLQLGYSDISTKDLVKSFQWQDDEAFNQQDIQQFNRVLFQALQKSLYGPKGSRSGLIKQLYEGELAHFTKCLECHNQSAKQETFQDLILIIKNIYEKVYNSCIQLSLQRYIKPEILDQDNLYDCSVCGKKVRAQRGVKFIKLPKLLNVVLQRFHFDYYTMTRNKINDKFTFPHVLNFNHYFNGYDQIPNKINEDSSEYFLQQQIPKKVVKSKPPPLVTKKVISKTGTTSTQPAVAGKVKTKPSATTKSFLQEMRKKKMQQQMQNQDLIFVSGNATAKQPQEKQTVTKSEENNNHVMQAQVPNGNFNDIIKQEPKQIKVITKYSPGEIPPPPPLALLEAMGPPVISDGYSNANINEIQQINGSGETIQKQLQRNLAQKEKLQAQKQKELEQLQIKIRQLVQQYLKDGPLVYELYSILVHSGTSNAGHYFSYIKSFENGRWYHFNDQRVTQINVTEIQKTFGGRGLSNAYVLYYRLVEQPKSKIDCPIPEYIKKIIKQEEEQYKMRQISKKIDLENTLILKIYFQLGVKTLEILKNSTFSLLFQKCKQTFNIKALQEGQQVNQKDLATFIKKDNIRLRLFNPVNDSKLDTYTGRQDSSLEQLGIRSYQNFILQVKADSQQFDEYMTGFMSVRIALWQQNQALLSLQQKNIKLHKISINKVANMFEFEQVVKKKRVQYLKQPINQNICIVKRHQNDEYLYHQIINLPDYYSKTVDNVGIFEGEILFVEADSENLNWPKQFENQINRITIKFINADNSQSQTLTTDSRISLNVLKEQVCAIIHQSVDQTIVRRGNRSGLELKTSTASLKQNRFINGTTLYLQRGIPAKQGQIRIQLFLSQDASLEHYNRLHQFQFISDVPIDTNLKASEVKNVFKNVLKRLRNVDYDCDKMRIRQKVNDKMGKIYREKPMKEQQLIEKREIAIELKQDNLQLKDYSIYVRVWNQNTWKLSQKLEFIVNKATTMKELAKSIYSTCKSIDQQNAILPEQMDICRILSIHKFNIIDLVDMEYFGMISEVSVLGEPMFVNSDGLLYIIKQTGIQPRALTKEQQNLFGGKVKATVRPTKGRSATSNPVKKQKGITIKVVQKMQEQEKQQ